MSKPRHDESELHEPTGRQCCPELNLTLTETLAHAIKAGLDEEGLQIRIITYLTDGEQQISLSTGDGDYTIRVERLTR